MMQRKSLDRRCCSSSQVDVSSALVRSPPASADRREESGRRSPRPAPSAASAELRAEVDGSLIGLADLLSSMGAFLASQVGGKCGHGGRYR
jgi:hypothetical protein